MNDTVNNGRTTLIKKFLIINCEIELTEGILNVRSWDSI